MAYWVFRDYVSERGVNEIEAWQDSLPDKAAAKVEMILAHLKGVKRLTRPYAGTRANFPHIFELVVTSGGQEFRPLFCYGPGSQDVTLLIGAEEKDGKLEPHAAEQIAESRRKIILADSKRTTPHE